MKVSEEMVLIAKANATVPVGTFRLRAFPTRSFQVDRSKTFLSEGIAQVVVQVMLVDTDRQEYWSDFSRNTVEELMKEVQL